MHHLAVTENGARMGFLDLPGAEPARLFVHGLGGSSLAYFTATATAPGLIGNRSLLVDLLGFGISDRPMDFSYRLTDQADAIARLLDQLQLSGLDVIAHSMGGSIAILIAARRPDLVKRLVVCESNLLPSPRPRIEGLDEDGFVREGFARALATTGDVWPITMRLSDPRALYRSERALGEAMPTDLTQTFTGLAQPKLMIVGDQTPAIHSEPEIRAAEIPITVIARAGHNMMLDNPRDFARAVSTFLQPG